jgi:hypothetical protein
MNEEDSDSSTASDTFVPGASERDESELARLGRLYLAEELDEHAAELFFRVQGIVHRAYSGEDITEGDVQALRRSLRRLEYTLEDFADPVVEDLQEDDDEDG